MFGLLEKMSFPSFVLRLDDRFKDSPTHDPDLEPGSSRGVWREGPPQAFRVEHH